MSENITTKFQVDVSQFKRGIAEANKQIRNITDEFNHSVSSMDDWSSSSVGVTAKLKQLNDTVEAQKKKLDEYKGQLNEVESAQKENAKRSEEMKEKLEEAKQEFGENSEEVKKYKKALIEIEKEEQKNKNAIESLNTTILRQQTTLNRTEREIQQYANQLEELERAENETKNTLEKLEDTFEEQTNALKDLKREYANVVLEQGKNSDAAIELEGRITDLNSELSKNRTTLERANSEAEHLADGLGEVEEEAENAGDGFTVMKGAMASFTADMIGKVIDAVKELASETDKAFNDFQVQTGTSKQDMKEFSKEIESLYKGNFGESLEDVADAMATVKQMTNETDPTKIKGLTENVLTLKDSFGFEVKESLRAVTMLMQEFGISGEEACNLIVQGVQKGLDKNDDLLDTINEYSVHYKNQGYSSEEFFNSLYNGAKEGAFSVDKLGDAVKEFGVRAIDGSDTTKKAFEDLGIVFKDGAKDVEKSAQTGSMSFEDFSKKIAEGGEGAKEAKKQIVDALDQTQDKVKKNEIGVSLFGTMWEDLGENAMEALLKTNGSIKKTEKSMEKIKDIKYNDIESEVKGIGRIFKTDILIPIVKEITPSIKKFVSFTKDNLNSIIPTATKIGLLFGTIFAVNKISNFASSVVNLTKIAKGFLFVTKVQTAATTTQTAAQTTLNTTMKLSPIGIATIAIGAIATAYGIWTNATKAQAKENKELDEKESELTKTIKEQHESYEKLKEAREDSVEDVEVQFKPIEKLKNELNKIVDANGKIKEGYEKRAKIITGKLSEALGIEIDVVDNVIQKYSNLKKEIREVIATKKAEAILSANQEMYTEAIKKQTEAYMNYNNARKEQKKIEEEIEKNREKSNEIAKKYEEEREEMKKEGADVTKLLENQKKYTKQLQDASEKNDKLKKKLIERQKDTEKAETQYISYINTIKNYEGVQAAIITGDTKKINKELSKLQNAFISAKNGTERTLTQQAKKMKENYEEIQKAVKEGAPGVTKQTVKEAKKLKEDSERELEKFKKSVEKKSIEAGAGVGEGFKKGIDSKKGATKEKGKELSKAAEKGAKKVNGEDAGRYFGEGFKIGMNNSKNIVVSAALGLANVALKNLKKGIDAHSPSRKSKKIGGYFSSGFALGIINEQGIVLKAVSTLSKNALKKLLGTSKNYTEVGSNIVSSMTGGIESAREKSIKAVEKIVNNVKTKYTTATDKYMKEIEKEYKKKNEKLKKTLKKTNKEKYNQQVKANNNELKEIRASAKEKQKEFATIATKLVNTYTNNIKNQTQKAVTATEKIITEITEKAQEKLDEFTNKQEQMTSGMKGYGELFANKNGVMIISDLKKETEALNKYRENMSKLKNKVTSELFDEVATMQIDDAIEYTSQLLGWSEKELKEYNKAYTEKQRLAETSAKNMYKADMESIKNTVNKEIKNATNDLNSKFKKIGKDALEGLVEGLKNNTKNSSSQVKKIANSIAKQFTSAFQKINDFGTLSGKGYILEFKETVQKTKNSLAAAIPSNNIKNGAIYESSYNTNNTTKNFYQTINSPKELSRLEIYRQSSNLLQRG